jgi:hypothetical protein
MVAEGRAKLEVHLKTADREALDRYCACMGLSMTQFIANRIREYERKMLQRFNEEQRARYLAGDLIWQDMSEEEHDAFRAPRRAVLHTAADERLRQATPSEVLGERTK